jgi:hypothetical protein
MTSVRKILLVFDDTCGLEVREPSLSNGTPVTGCFLPAKSLLRIVALFGFGVGWSGLPMLGGFGVGLPGAIDGGLGFEATG